VNVFIAPIKPPSFYNHKQPIATPNKSLSEIKVTNPTKMAILEYRLIFMGCEFIFLKDCQITQDYHIFCQTISLMGARIKQTHQPINPTAPS